MHRKHWKWIIMAIIKSVILRSEGLHQPEGWANNEYQKAKGPTTMTKTKTNYISPESGRSSHHSPPSLQDHCYWVAKAKNLPAPLALVQQSQMPADTAGLSPKKVGQSQTSHNHNCPARGRPDQGNRSSHPHLRPKASRSSSEREPSHVS